MLSAQVESYFDVIDELKPMFPLHFEELNPLKDRMKLNPQYWVYEQKQRDGSLMLVTVREDGEIIGYWVSFIAPCLHYQDSLANNLDIYWIHPEHRGKKAGMMLADKVKEESIRRGVDIWFVGSKDHKPSEWFFKHLGFDDFEKHFVMWLGNH